MVARRLEADAVIVGAGAAGSMAAAKLAAAGKRIIVLEAGPAWRIEDLTSSQIWARRLKWGGASVLSEGEHRFGHNMATGWGLGGAALHHYANWPRLSPDDFKLRSLHGEGADWPITYDDLRPFYDTVQREVGVSGDATAEVWRPPGEPYPHPAMPTLPQAAAIARGFAQRGWRTSPAPVAILTEPREAREACIYDGWCDAGCPTGALANPLVTYHKQAVSAGARFLANTQATRVLHRGGRRAIGVAFRDRDGEGRVEANVVLLAGSAIQTPRLLLASADADAPDGLANSSGQLGLGFMAHALVAIQGVFDSPLSNFMGVSGGNLVCRDGYGKDPTPGAFGSHEWVIGAALKPNDLIGIAMTRPDLHGAALIDFMERDGPRIGGMGGLCETLPRPENRVSLAPERDAAGVPLARVSHTFGAKTLALVDYVRREGEAIMRDAGAQTAWSSPIVTLHALGGTAMGDDPATSITNSYGQTWDLENLFILGGGLFPTIGAGGPTFTIHALTLRSSEYLLARWASVVR